jgi:hypothetical protein
MAPCCVHSPDGLPAEADVLVSGDKKHLLNLGSYKGIPIQSSGTFLRMLAD